MLQSGRSAGSPHAAANSAAAGRIENAMKTKKQPKSEEFPKPQDETISSAGGDSPAELGAPRWAVVTFEKCAAGALTYPEAVRKIEELEKQGLSGLCIVTNEAAERIAKQRSN